MPLIWDKCGQRGEQLSKQLWQEAESRVEKERGKQGWRTIHPSVVLATGCHVGYASALNLGKWGPVEVMTMRHTHILYSTAQVFFCRPGARCSGNGNSKGTLVFCPWKKEMTGVLGKSQPFFIVTNRGQVPVQICYFKFSLLRISWNKTMTLWKISAMRKILLLNEKKLYSFTSKSKTKETEHQMWHSGEVRGVMLQMKQRQRY